MQVLEGVRTLIVEDELLIALDIKSTLSEAGAHVVTTLFNVHDALELLTTCSTAFDLVTFDLNLRGRQSYPAIEMCLKLGKPAVIVSGNSPDALPAPFRSIPYVQKPFDDNHLVGAAVKALLAFIRRPATDDPM
jgi:CheY-like chemotaxis protein